MHILVSTRLPEFILEDMKNRLSNHKLIFEKIDDVSDDTLEKLDIVVSGGRPFSDRFYQKTRNLKLIQVPWIGVNNFEYDKLKERGIIVANSKWNTLLVAEFTLALILSGLKQIVRGDQIFRAGQWKSRAFTSKLLTNSRVLLIGFGDIAISLAKLLKSFNCEIVALRNNPNKTTEIEKELVNKVIGWEQFEQYAKDADVVAVTLPLTDKTEGILSAERLFQIKKQALLVNIGRGAVIDEEALYDALKQKHINAAIDVWYQYKRKNDLEPFYPSKYPIHELDNIIMSPHRASTLMDAPDRVLDDLHYNVKALENSISLINVIDMEKGY